MKRMYIVLVLFMFFAAQTMAQEWMGFDNRQKLLNDLRSDISDSTDQVSDTPGAVDSLATKVNLTDAQTVAGQKTFSNKLTGSDTVFTAKGLGVGRTSMRTWLSSVSVLEVAGTGAIWGTTTAGASNYLAVSQNIYNNGSNNVRMVADEVSYISLQHGGFNVFNSSYGAAGSTITLKTPLKVDSLGNTTIDDSTFYLDAVNNTIGLGRKDPATNYKLDIKGGITADSVIDRSAMYIGNNALLRLASINYKIGTSKGNGWAEVDHSTLPVGVRATLKYEKKREKATGKVWELSDVEKFTKNSIVAEDIKTHEPSLYRVNSKEYNSAETLVRDLFDPITVEEGGRNIGANMALMQKAITDLWDLVKKQQVQIDSLKAVK
uniref:Uncharacterized protein n=1 Tax=viral metagenome TaxID=1070528 RepID=A0A6M3KY46_9ZZZZ